MTSPRTGTLARDLDHVMERTRGLWEALRGERAFITGGTGFFGCWLLESFIRANEEFRLGSSATVLTRDPRAFRAKAPHLAGARAVTLLQGDIRDFAFPEGRFEFVIHAAAEASPRSVRETPVAVFDGIVEGTRRTLRFAAERGAKRFLYTSSGAVYGPQPEGTARLGEDCRLAPEAAAASSAYGEAKRASEFLCASQGVAGGVETTIARCFAFVGPYLPLDGAFAAGNFIRDALAGGPILVKGDGTARRSYLYAADLAVWLWTILLRGRPGRPYNVGSEHEISVRELAETTAGCVRPRAEVKVEGAPTPGLSASRYVPSTARAREELGLAESVGLEEAVRRTLEWHRGR
jgi:nucleoside-diphosphate-sugar epimerase